MGISYTAKKCISLDINLDTTILFECRWTLVRMREKGILLIIVIKCTPVSISLLWGKHDGLTDLYRQTTSFANYLNSPSHLWGFLKTWVLKWKVVSLTVKRGLQLAFSAYTLPGQITLVKFLMSFGGGGWGWISTLISIWWRHKNAWLLAAQREDMKKKNCQHERQPASPSRRMIALRKPPSGERVKWDWNPDRILKVGRLITHN